MYCSNLATEIWTYGAAGEFGACFSFSEVKASRDQGCRIEINVYQDPLKLVDHGLQPSQHSPD